MKKVLLLFIILFLVSFWVCAGTVDIVDVWSASMNRNIKVTVVSPKAEGKFPVVYLLHGYGGDNMSWLETTCPDLPNLADKHKMIFVLPDGDNSWYFDSPVNPKVCFETFITKELVSYIDKYYPTLAVRECRAITGFSMGGHGALRCAILHENVYCAAGSMSGGVDIVPYPNSWEIKKVLGTKSDLWNGYSVINIIQNIKSLSIIFDCGTDDFFYKDNVRMHKKMIDMKIEHDFTSRPGNHSHQYWRNSLDYHIIFFEKHFKRHL